MLTIIGVVNLTGDEVAIVMLFVNNITTMIFLAVKLGQQASGTTSTVTASVTTKAE